jgi:hypothetical protein
MPTAANPSGRRIGDFNDNAWRDFRRAATSRIDAAAIGNQVDWRCSEQISPSGDATK